MCIWLVDSAGVALGQRWRQEPGRWEFTGKMVVRPLQIEHWMERGFTRQQAETLYAQAVEYTVETLGEHVYRYFDRMDEYWFNVPPGRSENDIGEQLIATGYYRYVCPNWKSTPQSRVLGGSAFDECPDDPKLVDQWHHLRIESCAGWQIDTDGHDDVVISFVDTGMKVGHQDLSHLNEYRREGYNAETELWETQGGNINDIGRYCHGSIVLGAAAATGNNGVGVSGVGWSLRHRMLKTAQTIDTELHAMWVAAEAGDRVICSTSGAPLTNPSTWLRFHDNSKEIPGTYDVLILQAAGNDPDYQYDPLPYLVIVGGTQQNDARWIESADFGSPVGAFLDVMAPAADIFSTKCGSNSAYGTFGAGGNSYSTPLVAGLCALLWSSDPSLTGEEVLNLVYQGCDPIVGYSANLHGHGRINVFNSLALASGDLWSRDPYPGEAGVSNKFKAAGASNGATVRFYYGSSTGQTAVSGCTNVYVGSNDAIVLGESTAGSNGAAIYEATVPGEWAGQTRYFQAVDLSDCRVSNLIEFSFPSN